MQIVITGASSGLGAAIAKAINFQWQQTADHRDRPEIHNWSIEVGIDITRDNSVHAAELQKVDILINCAGVNMLSPIANIDGSLWARTIAVNAEGILLVTQVLLHKLHGGTICNILSAASTWPMTNSLAYAASKGAATSMTLVMARELSKSHGITVFGVAPNRIADTGISRSVDKQVGQMRGLTAEEVTKRQAMALPAGEETPVDTVAEFIAFLLSSKERHKYLHGCIIPYGTFHAPSAM